jgi:LytTr DNA-binding domain
MNAPSTAGRAGVASGAATRQQPGFRFPRWVWLAYALALAAIAVVGASSYWMEASRHGTPAAVWQLAVDEATSVMTIFALTPLLVKWTARLDPRRVGWGRTAAGHLAGAVAFSLVHIAGMTVLRLLTYPLFGSQYGFGDRLLVSLIYEGRKDALTYGGLVAGTWLLSMALRRRGVPAEAGFPVPGAPPRIEIRDGARRIWLDTPDVLWVEAAGNYVELHLRDRGVLRRQTLSAIERELADVGFVRIHRSRLVNLRHVLATETNDSGDFTVTLTDGRKVSGSRRWRGAMERFARTEQDPRNR